MSTVSTQSTPIRGPKSSRPAGPLASLGGSSATRPTGPYVCKTGDYVDCRTTPPPNAGPFGKLLNVRSEQAEVVIRSCAVTNLTVRVVGALGVVNSTFVPQLNDSEPTTRTVQPDPDCGRKLLGQHLWSGQVRSGQVYYSAEV